MSLVNRKAASIGRALRTLRDDRCFVVAAEDTDAPEQYFAALSFNRVKVVVLPTPRSSGLSAPAHVVERLKTAFTDFKRKNEVQMDDEFWVFLDTDHHIKGTHLPGTLTALRSAAQSGFEVAFSNPCFELWLLLHHADVPASFIFESCGAVGRQLAGILGGYNKTALQAGHFPPSRIPDAIRRARSLESNPDAPEDVWPPQTGTRVYRLLERVMQS
jgi:hypothetical protein